METLTLRHGNVSVVIDAAARRLVIELAGRRMPFEIDLGESLQAQVRRGDTLDAMPIVLDELTMRRISPMAVQWLGAVGGAGVALDMTLSEEGLRFGASPTGAGGTELVSVRWPGEISARGRQREMAWSNYNQGALFRPDGKPWSTRTDWTHAVMRLFGLTCDGQSLAAIVETSMDASAQFADDGMAGMSACLEFGPSMGGLAYPRSVLVTPLPQGGYVAIATAFRQYAQRHNLWISWQQRVDENPNVDKLRGAFIAGAGYFHDDGANHVAAMKTMRKMGFEQGYVFSPRLLTFGSNEWSVEGAEPNALSDAAIDDIQSLGYLCAPFLQVEEAGPALGMDNFALDAKGQKLVRWTIGEKKYYEIEKWRIPGMLAMLEDRLRNCQAIHFDTLTAMSLIESYGRRPYDRRGDAALRVEIAQYYRRRGKVICAESMRDWGLLTSDLATAKTFTPVYPRNTRVWAVPLTDLVYHDSTIRIHWEHHSYDDDKCVRSQLERDFHPFGMELNDLLTASPPVLFPEGTLYAYDLKPVTLEDGSRELEVLWERPARLYRKRITDETTQAALPKALRACKLNRRHGVARMTAHRFLGAGPLVQESEFDTGLHVVVNFGDEPSTLADGTTVGARSAIAKD